MRHIPTEQDGRIALRDHVIAKAACARARHGPCIDTGAIAGVLLDRDAVRYPVCIVFDAGSLQPGEFAHVESLGEHPGDGYRLVIHPCLGRREQALPMVIAYYIAVINYGEIATSDECEQFGATLLGLDVETYYRALCDLADSPAIAGGGACDGDLPPKGP